MKILKYLVLIITLIGLVACDGDEKIIDPIYEFISFQKETVTINEGTGSTVPSPIVLNLNGYVPKEDITIGLSILENNAVEGVDYNLSTKSLDIKAGNFISDTLFVSTIDNLEGSLVDRSIDISIESISNPDIKVGLGIENPTKAIVTVVIADDECSNTTDIFNSSNITNITPWGDFAVTGALNGDMLTLEGNLIAYEPLSNAKLEITLTPIAEGATKGAASFSDQVIGTDTSGWVYQLRQVGEGVYDVCSGTVSIECEVYYESGGWVYWYSMTNTFKLE